MDEILITRIAKKEQDKELVMLRDDLKTLLTMSRSKMCSYYPQWDKNLDVYRGIMEKDAEDAEDEALGDPQKFVVPMGFAQVQTFAAYMFLLNYQDQYFFNYRPTGPEDYVLRDISNLTVERDLRANRFNGKNYQFLIDVGRFGLGIFRPSWVRETVNWPVQVIPPTGNLMGFELPNDAPIEQMQEFVKYEGNKIDIISPYKFFPDTRLPLSEWHKGQFVADEEEWQTGRLKDLEVDGLVAGVEHIQGMTKEKVRVRGGELRFPGIDGELRKGASSTNNVVITTIQVDIDETKYKLGSSKKLRRWIVRIANDDRIISAEPMGYAHCSFTYAVGQFSPDMHQKVSDALSDVIYALQDLVTFLVNSRMMAVKRTLEDRVVVDPTFVDMNTVEARTGIIKLKKGAPRLGVDKFIRQLNVVDNTGKHLDDAGIIMNLMQMVTGVNENAMGQYHGGRRSASEVQAVNQGAGSRLKMIGGVLSDDTYMPLGKQLIINQRQGLSFETFTKIIGNSLPNDVPIEVAYQQFHKTAPELIGNEDLFVNDTTTQNERIYIAQSIQELALAVLNNPETAMMLNLDPRKMVNEIMALRGVYNLDRLEYEQNDYAAIQQQILLQQQQAGVGGINPAAQDNGGQPGGVAQF